MVETIELRRSALILPTTGCESEREEASYVEGGGFVGFQMTYNQTVAVSAGILSVTEIAYEPFGYAQLAPWTAALTGKIAGTVSACLSAIAVVGWIAIALFAARVANLVTHCLINKAGFKIGVDVGWLSAKGVFDGDFR